MKRSKYTITLVQELPGSSVDCETYSQILQESFTKRDESLGNLIRTKVLLVTNEDRNESFPDVSTQEAFDKLYDSANS